MITIYKIVEKSVSSIGNYLPFENDLDDIYGKIWTKKGNPIIKNCSSFTDINGNKLFNNALYLDGSSYLYTNIDLGGKDFTISFWVCPTIDKGNTLNYIFILWISNWLLIEYRNKNFLIRSSSRSDTNIINEQNLLNIWNHIALCYNHNESKIYVYLNGKFTQIYNYSLSNTSGEFIIGTSENRSDYYFTGYIKNFQIYDGNMRWTGDSINLSETYYTSDLNYIKKEYSVDKEYDYNVMVQRYINKNMNFNYINNRKIIKTNKFIFNNINRNLIKYVSVFYNTNRNIIFNIKNVINTKSYFAINTNIIYNNLIRKIKKTQVFQRNKTRRLLAKNNILKKFKISRNIEWTRRVIGCVLDPAK